MDEELLSRGEHTYSMGESKSTSIVNNVPIRIQNDFQSIDVIAYCSRSIKINLPNTKSPNVLPVPFVSDFSSNQINPILKDSSLPVCRKI